MYTVLSVICILLAVWGLTDLIWRLILWITLESHNRHILLVPVTPKDDPWFVVRGIKHRAALCGLKRPDEIAVVNCGLDEKKLTACRSLCKNWGVTFYERNDVELLAEYIYNEEDKNKGN